MYQIIDGSAIYSYCNKNVRYVLLDDDIMRFIFELLFYICPKSSSSMRNCFFTNIF